MAKLQDYVQQQHNYLNCTNWSCCFTIFSWNS